MKTLLRLISLFLLAAFLQNCTEDENLNPEKLQFTIGFTPLSTDGGRIKSIDLPPGASVLVSIETNTGAPVITNRTIELLSFGDAYVTAPLELRPGSYRIADFMIVNSASEVLYATPKSGSPLAGIVAHSLPHGFSVTKDNVKNVAMEVVSVSENNPEDFGYAAFNVKIVHPLRLSVFIPSVDGLKLTSATAVILKNTDTLRVYSLQAKVNLLSFKEDTSETFTMVVTKDGYGRYARNFNYNDLMAELAGSPLEVILEPAFTMVARVRNQGVSFGNPFRFIIEGYDDIVIDWGDGTSDTGSGELYQLHNYAEPGNYFVSVTGDIESIGRFYSYYGIGEMSKINVDHLPELTSFSLGLTYGPKTIDLSHNPKIEDINIAGIEQLESIILPYENKINFITVAELNSITTASVDDIINKVFSATITDDRRGGYITLNKGFNPEISGMVGPPSPASLTKLRSLRDDYQWHVSPDF